MAQAGGSEMGRRAPFKVFRTPIGFHDAYIAASSRKAALEAWGASKDLFASGSAELVTDPDLTALPLAQPGKVIKLARGSLTEHLEAGGEKTVKVGSHAKTSRQVTPPSRCAAASKPRPSRHRIDLVEAELAAFEEKAALERATLDRREADLLHERQALNLRHGRTSDKIEARLERVRVSYEQAIERWRADI